MPGFIQLIGNERTVQLFGIRLIGVSAENSKKLLITIIFLAVLFGLTRLLHFLVRLVAGRKEGRFQFWVRQALRLLTAVLLIMGFISIWFTDPSRLASAAALVTAGLAVASQKVISAISGYFVILRGKNFNVGDRIVMGGVRGDVISLGFMQTTIMEMGQPPPEQGDAPSMLVAGRQYTGRIVTINNDKVFDEPVYNYSSEFPYIWEEMRLLIPYNANRDDAERIILDAASRHTAKLAELSEDALRELERRYLVPREELEPRVYVRLTDKLG